MRLKQLKTLMLITIQDIIKKNSKHSKINEVTKTFLELLIVLPYEPFILSLPYETIYSQNRLFHRLEPEGIEPTTVRFMVEYHTITP